MSSNSTYFRTCHELKFLQLQAESPRQHTQYAHLPGASAPYATLTRAETYTPPPAAGRSVPPRSPPHAFQVPAHAQQQQRQQCPVEFKCSASAMGVYHAHEHEDHPARPSGDFKRSVSVIGMLGNANTMGWGSGGGSSLTALVVGSGIVLGVPASALGRVPAPLSRAPTPGPRSGTPQPQPTGFLAVPGAANSIGAGVGRDKEKDQASIALRAMRSVRSMARLWDGPGVGQRSAGGAGVCEGEQEGGAGEPVHVRGEEADAAERCVPRLVALVICCEWGEWGECGGAADVDGGGGDAG
ncbi:hypothetical protein B0H14DRAFT_3694077 [Mycena olivaceomarginata]|nr:hypothetical protein B0H14DRAFT_3694077 [Mycena olivaceomarginata]